MKDVRPYRIGGRELLLPEDSCLERYKQQFPSYDAFLPYLAGHLREGWIIDIGANVGDTLYALLDVQGASFLCVEPCTRYYDLLARNVAALPADLAERVRLARAFVSSEKQAIRMEAGKGTAHGVISETGESDAPVYSIDELADMYAIQPDQCSLIKIDTDGFDDKCLLSGMEFLKKADPILMWENIIDTNEHLQRYKRCFFLLEKRGYSQFYAFDNTGNFITRFSRDGILDFLQYTTTIYAGKTVFPAVGRHTYYLDIVCCRDSRQEEMDAVMAGFREARRQI